MSLLVKESWERVILSSVTQGNDLSDGLADQLVSSLTEDSFTSTGRRYLFNCIKDCRSKRLSPNSDILLSYVTGNDSQMEGDAPIELSYLYTAMSQTNIDSLIKGVKEYHKARLLEEIALGMPNRLNSTQELSEELSSLNNEISNIYLENTSHNSGGFVGEFLLEFMEDLQKISEADGVVGLPLGIPSLDDKMGGARGGEVIVVAGLPSMGKTSWVVSMIARMIVDGKAPVMFSIEMTRKEMIGRLIPQVAELMGNKDLSYSQLRNPNYLNAKAREAIKIAFKKIKDSRFFIDDNGRTSVEDIRATCHRLKREGSLDLIVVDYLQLMIKDEHNATSELANITSELKRIAKEFDVPVVELSQLNKRDCSGGRPTMGNLKGSGSIEQNADAVLFCWREYAITREGAPEDMVILQGKGRGYDSNDIPCYFSTQTLSVSERDGTPVPQDDYRGGF